MFSNAAHSIGKMIFLLVLAGCLALPAFGAILKNETGFSKTCQHIKIVDGTYLQAYCLDASATHPYKNTLDLDMCVGIDQNTGVLHWEVL